MKKTTMPDHNSGGMENSLTRELKHHDHWASEIDVSQIDVIRAFEGSTAPENRFIIQNIGTLEGKRILDLGCGAGEASVYFSLKGASCVAADYSPGMVNTALELARHYNVSIEGKQMDSMSIDFPDESFDIVYAANLLHHTHPESTLSEMRRVVRKNGVVCFWDPLRHNPIINIYRRMATKVRSEDEKPLDIDIVKSARSLFKDVTYDTFWISTLWIFLRFYLLERVDPNKERYWKKILIEEERLRKTYQRLEKVDNVLKGALPFIKRYAWNIAAVAVK